MAQGVPPDAGDFGASAGSVESFLHVGVAGAVRLGEEVGRLRSPGLAQHGLDGGDGGVCQRHAAENFALGVVEPDFPTGKVNGRDGWPNSSSFRKPVSTASVVAGRTCSPALASRTPYSAWVRNQALGRASLSSACRNS